MAAGSGTTRRSFLAGGLTAALGAAIGGPSILLRDGPLGPGEAVAAEAAGGFPAAVAAVVSDPPLREADYWRFADWVQPEMDKLWNEAESSYTRDSRIAACGLMTHAIAALQGHEGPCRHDERARRMAARLCQSPPFRPTPGGGPTRHTDPRNQINFAAELHACAASMTGDSTLLRRDYRRQLGRFLDGSRRALRPWRIPNLSPSYGFHRNPFARAGNRQNIESNEYACIVMDVIYYYEQARRAGMSPLSEGQARTLRAWVQRALPAYWTHAGYLNWDTGLYLYRWHLSRYWAWSCQGLLAIASSQNFVEDEQRRWAKFIFDRSLSLYERLCERWADDRREPGSSLYGVTTKFSQGPHFELARFQALAAEAVLRGLGDKEATEPPPLYAFDPQIARLAVTTPAYNTALVPVSNDAFPYGGIDLARLFDSRQRVVSHIGGRAPAGMGLVVRAADNSIVSASQRSRATLPKGQPPVVLTRSPRGPVTRGVRYPREPYAGPFTGSLDAEGFSERSGIRFRCRYRFWPDRIDIGWQVSRGRTDALSAEALLPSWGDEATIDATLKTGAVKRLLSAPGQGQVDLAAVDWFLIDGEETGYAVVPGAFPAGAVGRLLKPGAQSSNPRPGTSLSIRLSPAVRDWRTLSLDVTIAPAGTAAEAKAFVAGLRAGGGTAAIR